MKHLLIPIAIWVPLAACGVADVGTAAVTQGKLQAEQAKQGKETADKLKADLDAAAKAEEDRLRKAEAEAGK